jgi:hypothetical protein
MDKEVIFLIEEAPEGGFTAKALDHAIFTEADNLDELKPMVQEAVRCHFDEAERPAIIRLLMYSTPKHGNAGPEQPNYRFFHPHLPSPLKGEELIPAI